MAFKMKAGKEGPKKKNFGISPMKNDEMAKAVAEAKAKNEKANKDPNKLQGIDPKKFAEMLRSE